MRKRRQGFPSESQVKAGDRFIPDASGDPNLEKELIEKLGRKDPCPCGSGLRFKRCCLRTGRF